MGMSSSQGRLLAITSGMHDIEYAIQNIQNKKVALATQRDDVYKAYCEALDATKIQVAFNSSNGGKAFVDATFDSVCKFDPARTQQYSIKDADSGKAIVSKEVYDIYKNYGFTQDKYAFAWAMLGLQDYSGDYNPLYDSLQHEFQSLGVKKDETGGDFESLDGSAASKLMTSVEQAVYDEVIADDNHGLEDMYNEFWELEKNGDNALEKWEAFNTFRSALYKYYGSKIYQQMQGEDGNTCFCEEWADMKDEYNYYIHVFEEIQNCGGCICIDEYADGKPTDNEWFNNAVESGRVLIDMFDEKNGWTETSVATSTNNNLLQRVSDPTDEKKAEAEYEYELSKINKKDTEYDKSLSTLNTRHQAYEQQMEQIRKFINENTDRTFSSNS